MCFLQIDGAYAVVRCQGRETTGETLTSSSGGKDDPTSLLSDCRILRKDDLQLVKGFNASKIPDFFQKAPKRIMVPENGGHILTTAIDTQGWLVLTV